MFQLGADDPEGPVHEEVSDNRLEYGHLSN